MTETPKPAAPSANSDATTRPSLLEQHAREAADLERSAQALWNDARAPEAAPTYAPPPDPTQTTGYKMRRLLADIWWNLRILRRWSRPKVKASMVPVREGSQHVLHLVMGQIRWGWRRFKNNPAAQRLTYQIATGFGIAILLFALWLWAGKPLEDVFTTDPNVPAPNLEMISEIESDENVIIDSAMPPPPPTANKDVEELGPNNFRLEYFAQRDAATGKIKLYNNAAESYVKQWYNIGTPAKPLMSFVGHMLERAAGRKLAFEEHCMKLPVNKVFREATITCTYAHPLPPPFRSEAEKSLRAFWIISMNYDGNLNIRDVQVHARLVQAGR